MTVDGRLFDRMTADERYAYEWSIRQQFSSVAARYARSLAQFIKANEDITQPVEPKPINAELLEACEAFQAWRLSSPPNEEELIRANYLMMQAIRKAKGE
jgi:hypothetical protein